MATWLTEALIGWDGWAWDRVFASTTGPVASGRAGVLPPPARQPHRRPLSHRRHAAGRPHLPRTTLKRAGAMSTEVGWQSHPRAWAPRRGRGQARGPLRSSSGRRSPGPAPQPTVSGALARWGSSSPGLRSHRPRHLRPGLGTGARWRRSITRGEGELVSPRPLGPRCPARPSPRATARRRSAMPPPRACARWAD